MVRFFPKPQQGPLPCPVCGRLDHKECAETIELKVFAPEYVDQRVPWRFRSKRDVLRKLDDHGRYEKVWSKGAVIPPSEAIRQGLVKFAELTPREKAEVEATLARLGGQNRRGPGAG